MHRSRSVAALAALLASVVCRAGHAEGAAPRTSSLSWVRLAGADACVSTQELARGVEARLGRAVFVSAAQGDLSVEGRIEPARGKPGWRATLVLRDAKGAQLGTRELVRDEASCEAMREPLVLVVALMIDPDATPAPPTPAPAPPPPQTIVVEKQVQVYVSVPVEAPRAPEPPAWHFDGGASLAASLGLFGHPGLGGHVSGLLEPPGFVPLEGYGSLWVDPTSAGGPTFSLAYAGAGLCPLRHREGRLAAYGCASGQLGYLRTAASSSAKVYAAGAIEARLSARLLGPLAARAGISLVVPLLEMASPVAATLDFGFGVTLP